jgi:hypothetical protein
MLHTGSVATAPWQGSLCFSSGIYFTRELFFTAVRETAYGLLWQLVTPHGKRCELSCWLPTIATFQRQFEGPLCNLYCTRWAFQTLRDVDQYLKCVSRRTLFIFYHNANFTRLLGQGHSSAVITSDSEQVKVKQSYNISMEAQGGEDI